MNKLFILAAFLVRTLTVFQPDFSFSFCRFNDLKWHFPRFHALYMGYSPFLKYLSSHSSHSPCSLQILLPFVLVNPYHNSYSKKLPLTTSLPYDLLLLLGTSRPSCTYIFHRACHSVLLSMVCLTPLCLFCSGKKKNLRHLWFHRDEHRAQHTEDSRCLLMNKWTLWKNWNQNPALLISPMLF